MGGSIESVATLPLQADGSAAKSRASSAAMLVISKRLLRISFHLVWVFPYKFRGSSPCKVQP